MLGFKSEKVPIGKSVLGALAAIAFLNFSAPKPTEAKEKPAITLSLESYQQIVEEYRKSYESKDVKRQLESFVKVMQALKSEINFGLRHKFWKEWVETGKVPILIKVIYPNVHTLDTNLDLVDFDIKLIQIAQKVHEMLSDEKTDPTGGLSRVEKEWLSVNIAKNLLISGSNFLEPSRDLVITMLREIFELQRHSERSKIFGPETIVISAIEKFNDGHVGPLVPDNMLSEIRKYSRLNDNDHFNLDTYGPLLKKSLSDRIKTLKSGSTIVLATHGVKAGDEVKFALFSIAEKNTTISASEFVDMFVERIKNKPSLATSDKDNPFTFIVSECDPRTISSFLKIWALKTQGKFGFPRILSETEENAKALTSEEDPNFSEFFSRYIFNQNPVSANGLAPQPTIGGFMRTMLETFKSLDKSPGSKKYLTKPTLFLPLKNGLSYRKVADKKSTTKII